MPARRVKAYVLTTGVSMTIAAAALCAWAGRLLVLLRSGGRRPGDEQAGA